MGNSTIFKEKLVLLYRYKVIAIIFWIVIIITSLLWNIYQEHKSIEAIAINEAYSSFKRDEAFRLFIASRGGVYVPLDDKTPSNPYLRHPERDITTTSGKKLTLMNGAYFFHKVMEEYGYVTGVKWRLASLKPTNPANTPDEWEQETLRTLEQQRKMMVGFSDIRGEPYLRLLSPLVTVESCLKCHGYQGYKVGEIRGAMGVFLPMASYLVEQRRAARDLIWTHGIFGLLGLFGIVFASRKIRMRFLENIQAEEDLERYRTHLEDMVGEKTQELTETNLRLNEENTVRKQVEEKLRYSSNLLQNVLDSIPSAVFWKDRDLIYLGGNRIWLNEVGLKSSQDVVGKSDYDLPWEKKEADSFREYDRKIMESGIPEYDIIEPYRRADGTQAWAKTNKVPLRDTEGTVIGVLGTYEDITERKRAEEELKESEERYRSLFDNSIDAVLLTAPDGSIFRANPEACRIFGFTEEELQQFGRDRVIDKTDARLPIALEERRQTGRFKGELNFIRSDGTKFPGELSSNVFKDSKGNLRTSMIIRDITERKRAEEELRRSKELMEKITHGINESILLLSKDLKILWANKAISDQFGYEMDEILGKYCYKITHRRESPCESPHDKCPVEEVQETGKPITLFHTHFDKGESEKFVEVSAYPIRDEEGEVVQFIHVCRDVSERKRAEEALQKSESSLAEAQRIAHVGSWEWYLETNDAFWSDETYRMFGLKGGRLERHRESFLDFIHPDDQARVSKALDDGVSGAKEYDIIYRIILHDGAEKVIHARAETVRNSEGKPIMMRGTVQDITERKKAEEALRESQARLELAIRASNTGLFDWDLRTNKVYFSPEWKKQIGYEIDEISDDFSEWESRVHPDDLDRTLRTVESFIERPWPNYEVEFRFRHKDGSYRWILTRASLMKDTDGKPYRMLGSHLDITERKQAEEAILREKLLNDAIVANIPAGVAFLDNDFVLRKYNHIYGGLIRTYTPYTPEQALGMSYFDYVPGSREQVEEWFKGVRDSGKVETIFGFKLVIKGDGQERITYWDTSVAPVLTPARKVEGILILTQDVTERKQAQEVLEESERKYKGLIETALDGYIMTDMEGNILDCNKAFLDMLGYTMEEITNLSYQDLTPPKWHSMEAEIVKRQFIQRGYSDEYEKEYIRKNGEVFPLSIRGRVIKDEQGKPIGMWGFVRDITERKRAEEQLRMSAEQLRSLSARLQAIREEERTTIAREIHDELGQALTGLKMDLSWLGKKFPEKEELIVKTQSMLRLVDSTIQTVRRISTELRPGILDDLGLIAAIEWQAKDFENRTGIKCKFLSSLEEIDLDKDRSTAAFRIFQETLTNVARHTKATQVKVDVEENEGNLLMKVADNGLGIRERDIVNPKSLGLLGMKERAHIFGGQVEITGEHRKGTTVTVRIPLIKDSNQ